MTLCIHTPEFHKPVMEKPNYDHLKTEMIISFNCLQENKGFHPLEKFTIPQMRYLSLQFPYNLAKDRKKTSNRIRQIFSTAHGDF